MSVKNKEKEVKLEERTKGIGVCCENCKFCNKYFVYDDIDGENTCVHLCFVDGEISPEDDEYLLEIMQGAGSPWFYEETPKEFRELLMLPAEEARLEDSPRFVRCNEMCNHYLPGYDNLYRK